MNAHGSSVRSGPAAPRSVEEAIDDLVTMALRKGGTDVHVEDVVDGAATMLRRTMLDLTTTQEDLTEALIANQDRLLAMRALAQINVQGVASDETVGLLLDKALDLTGSSLILLFDERQATTAVGDTAALDDDVAIAVGLLSEASGDPLHPTAVGRVMISALDPDGEAERYVVFFRPTGCPFSTVDIPLVEAITSALGVMLAFTELHRREMRQAAVEREHQIASALAQSVIDDEAPRSEVIDTFAKTVPAAITGGDFYVFTETDGRLWFAVGDVAGKGLPAAMLMMRAVGACRAAFLIRGGSTIEHAFQLIEDELFEHLERAGLFVTMVVGVAESDGRTVSLANAGHSPVVHVHGDDADLVLATAPPVGVIRHRSPATSTFALDDADCLILGSDGLPEQCAPSGELFGYDRFVDLCTGLGRRSTSGAGQTIFETVDAFADGCPASDDSTLVILKRPGGAS